MTSEEIISLLPYQPPFLFVDGLASVSDSGVKGYYTFKENEFFYKGHFKDGPITPGVILTECMAQIGVVCLGIYLMKGDNLDLNAFQIALTSNQVDFFIPVFPGERVTVVSEKEVFRFKKLKCKVSLYNEKNELVCRGRISGMIKTQNND